MTNKRVIEEKLMEKEEDTVTGRNNCTGGKQSQVGVTVY